MMPAADDPLDASVTGTVAIRVDGLGKFYQMYDRPQDRLKQSIVPRLQRLIGRDPSRYGREFWALRDVSFQVARGETVGIIGRNGSGKSTLLQMICGTLTPSSGSVEVNGRIAAMLELGSGFNPEFTGRDNVYMNGAVLGLEREEIDRRFPEIAAFAGIGDFIDQPVKTYSSGMAVRLAFAVSVCVEPDVLVVDEALAVGDMAFQQQCLQRLADLREAGTTILLVTHDIMLTRNYCSRVVYLDHGCVKAIGEAEAVGEMYLKDTLAAQHGPAHAASGIEWKPDSGRLRFGSTRGEITSSTATVPGRVGTVFQQGDTIRVTVDARVDADIRNPQIVVQLRDSRGYVLYGLSTAPSDLRITPLQEGRQVQAALHLVARLGPGEYSLSLGLVDRHGESVSTVLDKIVAALPFVVAIGAPTLSHGPVDLGATWVDPGGPFLDSAGH
jgi:lipopolysaccharide transport system ATP-binding protein